MSKKVKYLILFLVLSFCNLTNLNCLKLYLPDGYSSSGYQVSHKDNYCPNGNYGSYNGTTAYCYKYLVSENHNRELYCLSPAGDSGTTSDKSSKVISTEYTLQKEVKSSTCTGDDCRKAAEIGAIFKYSGSYCETLGRFRYWAALEGNYPNYYDVGSNANKIALFKMSKFSYGNIVKDHVDEYLTGQVVPVTIESIKVKNKNILIASSSGIEAVEDSHVGENEVWVFVNTNGNTLTDYSSDNSVAKVNTSSSKYVITIDDFSSIADDANGHKRVNVTFNYKSSKTVHDYGYRIYGAGGSYQYFLEYYDNGTNTVESTTNVIVNIKRICQTCEPEEIKPPKSDTVDCDVTDSSTKRLIELEETPLCNLVPNQCGIVNKEAQAYKVQNVNNCDIYCSDKIEMELFTYPKERVYAGRKLVYDIFNDNSNLTGKLRVKRSCALIPKKDGGCKDSSVAAALTALKPVSCDLISNFDYNQNMKIDNQTVTQLLNSSVDKQNTFATWNLSFCQGDYRNYCVNGAVSCSSGGNMTCNSNSISGQFSDIAGVVDSLNGSDVIKLELQTGDINISLDNVIYQKPYSTILSLAEQSSWYNLGSRFYPISPDTLSGSYTTTLNYQCLGSSKSITGTYSCPYALKNYTTKFTCEDGDTFNDHEIACFSDSVTEPGNREDLAFFFRTVDLTKMIPASREDGTGNSIIGVNWTDAMDSRSTLTTAQEEINKLEEEYKDKNIWNKTPEYVVTITPDGVKEILKYNDKVGNDYQNETLEYDGYWKSSALTELNGKSGITVTRSSTFRDNMYNNY